METIHSIAQTGDKEYLESKIRSDGPSSVHLRDEFQQTPLHIASFEGHVGAAISLLNYKADVDAQDKNGWTPLHSGARNGHFGTINVLVDYGANPVALTNDGTSPLHYLVRHEVLSDDFKRYHRILNVLTPDKVRIVNLQNHNGETPLHEACRHGRICSIDWLLENGAKVNLSNTFGETPLHYVCRTGIVEAARKLLDAGADVSIAGKYGNSKEVASISGHEQLLELLNEVAPDVPITDTRVESPTESTGRLRFESPSQPANTNNNTEPSVNTDEGPVDSLALWEQQTQLQIEKRDATKVGSLTRSRSKSPTRHIGARIAKSLSHMTDLKISKSKLEADVDTSELATRSRKKKKKLGSLLRLRTDSSSTWDDQVEEFGDSSKMNQQNQLALIQKEKERIQREQKQGLDPNMNMEDQLALIQKEKERIQREQKQGVPQVDPNMNLEDQLALIQKEKARIQREKLSPLASPLASPIVSPSHSPTNSPQTLRLAHRKNKGDARPTVNSSTPSAQAEKTPEQIKLEEWKKRMAAKRSTEGTPAFHSSMVRRDKHATEGAITEEDLQPTPASQEAPTEVVSDEKKRLEAWKRSMAEKRKVQGPPAYHSSMMKADKHSSPPPFSVDGSSSEGASQPAKSPEQLKLEEWKKKMAQKRQVHGTPAYHSSLHSADKHCNNEESVVDSSLQTPPSPPPSSSSSEVTTKASAEQLKLAEWKKKMAEKRQTHGTPAYHSSLHAADKHCTTNSDSTLSSPRTPPSESSTMDLSAQQKLAEWKQKMEEKRKLHGTPAYHSSMFGRDKHAEVEPTSTLPKSSGSFGSEKLTPEQQKLQEWKSKTKKQRDTEGTPAYHSSMFRADKHASPQRDDLAPSPSPPEPSSTPSSPRAASPLPPVPSKTLPQPPSRVTPTTPSKSLPPAPSSKPTSSRSPQAQSPQSSSSRFPAIPAPSSPPPASTAETPPEPLRVSKPLPKVPLRAKSLDGVARSKVVLTSPKAPIVVQDTFNSLPNLKASPAAIPPEQKLRMKGLGIQAIELIEDQLAFMKSEVTVGNSLEVLMPIVKLLSQIRTEIKALKGLQKSYPHIQLQKPAEIQVEDVSIRRVKTTVMDTIFDLRTSLRCAREQLHRLDEMEDASVQTTSTAPGQQTQAQLKAQAALNSVLPTLQCLQLMKKKLTA